MNYGFGILFVLGIIGVWMYCTTPRFREVVFGYVMLLGVIAWIVGLLTGQGLVSAYDY